MRQSIYLTDDLVAILKCYGPLDKVVHNILVAGAEGLIDIMDKPAIGEKSNGRYYQINIEEPNYINLVESYGSKSSRISLRRLLYWFVENEIYCELNWEPCEEFTDDKLDKKHQVLADLKQALFKAKTYIPEHRVEIDEFRNLIIEIEDELWYAK